MKLSEFRFAVREEFGEMKGRAYLRDLSLAGAGGLTAEEALEAGFSAGDVWVALCREAEVPVERWHGRGRPERD